MIDSHVHISLDSQRILHHQMMITEYKNYTMDSSQNKAIVFLNPFDNKFCCPNAFEERRLLHKSYVVDVNNYKYRIKCQRCDNVHYEGEDVFRKDNIELLNVAQKNNYYALALITAPGMAIQNQVDYYESFFPAFVGYKIHPTIMMYPVEKLHFESEKTVLFHCGNDDYSSPKQIIKFAKEYKGNVVIAHFARFDKVALKSISEMDNVWVDTSPFTFLYELTKKRPSQLIDSCGYNGEEERAKDLFLELGNIVGFDKILFASDAPFGDYKTEVSFLDSLSLGNDIMNKIREDNARKAFNI